MQLTTTHLVMTMTNGTASLYTKIFPKTKIPMITRRAMNRTTEFRLIASFNIQLSTDRCFRATQIFTEVVNRNKPDLAKRISLPMTTKLVKRSEKIQAAPKKRVTVAGAYNNNYPPNLIITI